MNLEYYDFKRISRVGLLESKFNISDFDVCPFNPSISAYLNGSFNIVDVRDNNKPLLLYQNQNNIHCGNIIKWNPIVPYWIATATNTSLNFYDIRYNSGSPISIIKHGNIHELCWSSGNSDLILANSRDRRMNLWSLNHSEDDCRLGMTMTRFDIGSLTNDLNNLNMFYGLDDSDSLIKIEIRSEYLSKLAPIDDTIDSEFQIIEESIYAGDFDKIKRKLEQISSESDYKTLKNLVSLLSRKFIKNSQQEPFDETLISSITRTSSSSTILKANNIMSSDQVLTEIQNLIDKLRLKIRLIELLAANDFESVKKFFKLIVSEICKNENFLEMKVSIKLFALVLKNDRSMALNFLKEFIGANPFGISENLKNWIWMFVFPSIFDAKSYELIKIRPSLSKSIVNCHDDSGDVDDSWENYLSTIRNQFYDSILNSKDSKDLKEDLIQENQKIIQQVYLNLEGNPIKLEKFLTLEACLLKLDNTDNVFVFDAFEKDILDEKEEGEPIISAELIKILLEKSFKTSSKTSKTTFLRDFFLLAFRLTVLTERTPINLAISEFISTVAFSKLKLILSTLENSETLKASAIEMLNEIVNDSYCTFTDEQLDYLSNAFE